MRLLFVEFPEHVDEARRLAMGAEIIALTPHAAAELESTGTAYRFPEDVFPWRDLEDAGIDFLASLQRTIARMDELLCRRIALFQQKAFTPALFGTYEILVVSGAIWAKLYRVLRIIQELPPTHITYFAMPAAKPDDPFDFDRGSLYADVIACLCQSLNIANERIEKSVPPPCRWTLHPVDVPRPSVPSTFMQRLGRRISRYRQRILNCRPMPRVLVIQCPLPPELLQQYVRVLTWPSDESEGVPIAEVADGDFPAGEIESAWREMVHENELRAVFHFEGHDWFPLVEERLEQIVTGLVPRGFRAFASAQAAIERLRPDALLFANFYNIELHAIAHAARQRNIPVICEPHGPYGHFVNYVCPLLDAISVTDYLIGGAGVARYHQAYYSLRWRERCTGAAMMDRARAHVINRTVGLRALGLDPQKPVVMFVIQNVCWNREYVPYTERDDRRTWRIEKQILEVLARHANFQIILKGHPATSYPLTPLRAHAQSLFGERFRYVASWPFIDMLDMADVFILGYAVTTIYQALTRSRRVYAINDFYPVVPFHRHLLEGATYYAEDVDSFCTMLDADLATGDAFRPSTKDHHSFLRELADPGGEGTPTTRIARAIHDIAAEYRDG